MKRPRPAACIATEGAGAGSRPRPASRREPRRQASSTARTGSFCAHPLVARLLGIERAHTDDLLARIGRGEDVDIPGAVRASIGLGSTVADIDALLAGLGEL